MSMEKMLEIVAMQIPVVVGLVWKVAKAEQSLYEKIDEVKDHLSEEFTQIDKRLDLHIQDSKSAREMLNYKVDGQSRRLASKINRVEAMLRDVQNWMGSLGFRLRAEDRTEEDN